MLGVDRPDDLSAAPRSNRGPLDPCRLPTDRGQGGAALRDFPGDPVRAQTTRGVLGLLEHGLCAVEVLGPAAGDESAGPAYVGAGQAQRPRRYAPRGAVRARSCGFCSPVVTQSVTHRRGRIRLRETEHEVGRDARFDGKQERAEGAGRRVRFVQGGSARGIH